MEIRPYRGTDEAELLAVWDAAMTHDRVSGEVFRTRVLLDSNFLPENLPVPASTSTPRRLPVQSQNRC